jgi:hypothetical protein
MRGDYRALFLLLAAAVSYVTFLAVAMPTSLNLNGDCLYLFWAPEATPSLNPFWLFVYLIGFLFVLAILLAVTGWKQGRSLNVLAGVFLVLVLMLWADDLGELWDVIEKQRSSLSADDSMLPDMPLADQSCNRKNN